MNYINIFNMIEAEVNGNFENTRTKYEKTKEGGTRVKLGRESLCQNNQTWNCNCGQSLCSEPQKRSKYEIQLKILQEFQVYGIEKFRYVKG